MYLSVAGPGKNFQLAPGSNKYYFKWIGDYDSGEPGYLDFSNESLYPGKILEPVTLVGPAEGDTVGAGGATFSCEVSENAVGYQLLLGCSPGRMSILISDTATPPSEIITTFPFENTYWTIKARDQFGSTIHADPILIKPENVVRNIVNLSTDKVYCCIQDAIHEADPYDEIEVRPAIYLENIDFEGKNLTVRSADPCDSVVVANTVIQGTGHGSVVTFAGSEDPCCVLAGFTITRGNAGKGGGICGNGTRATIRNCNITANHAQYGGGIAEFNGLIEGCTIAYNNSSQHGGGVYNENNTTTIYNCEIRGNVANGWGGGIYQQGGQLTMSKCAVKDNQGSFGAGIKCREAVVNLTNCIISGNYAWFEGGGLDFYQGDNTIHNCTIYDNSAQYVCGGVLINLADHTVKNCIIWDNSDMSGKSELSQLNVYGGTGEVGYNCIQNWTGSLGGLENIGSDPCFADPCNGDYHLRASSGCIDAGDPCFVVDPCYPVDMDGKPRVIGDRVDMGVYEFEPPTMEVAMKFTPQALNPGSQGNWIKAHFVLPEGFGVDDVDADTPAMLEPLGIESEEMNVFINDAGLVEIEAAFYRSDFCATDIVDDSMELIIRGRFTSGQYFYGSDSVKITSNHLEFLAVLSQHWLETGCDQANWCKGADLNQDNTVNLIDLGLYEDCLVETVKK